MAPHEARADAGAVRLADTGTRTTSGAVESTPRTATDGDADTEDTLDLRLPDEFVSPPAEKRAGTGGGWSRGDGPAAPASAATAGGDLLDCVADWGPVSTPVGGFQLVPVRIETDLPLVGHWMTDPAVAAFWELARPRNATEEHVRTQLEGDGRSVPCLGVLDGTPMSYWEIYRADLDPLARHYPARPHDTGIHLLIGGVADRGRGLGGVLLRAVADLVLDKRSACARVVAEPDLRNIASIAAFLGAGFRFSAEIELPAKRAALMVRERSLRHRL